MSLSVKKVIVFLVFIIPTVVLMTMGGTSFMQLERALTVELPIEGYDPRDPFMGHYFQFQMKWPWRADKPIDGCKFGDTNGCRVCVAKKADGTIETALISDDKVALSQCHAHITGLNFFDKAPPGSRTPVILMLQNEPHRIYIDERDGQKLEDYFRDHPLDFSLRVKIHNERIHVKELLIKGRPYREVLGKEPPETPRKP